MGVVGVVVTVVGVVVVVVFLVVVFLVVVVGLVVVVVVVFLVVVFLVVVVGLVVVVVVVFLVVVFLVVVVGLVVVVVVVVEVLVVNLFSEIDNAHYLPQVAGRQAFLSSLSLASLLWDISKQHNPRCDAAERGVPSGVILFAQRISSKNEKKLP